MSRRRPGRSGFAWCVTTGAATASPVRRRAPIRWTCWAVTHWPSPMPPASRNSAGAGKLDAVMPGLLVGVVVVCVGENELLDTVARIGAHPLSDHAALA